MYNKKNVSLFLNMRRLSLNTTFPPKTNIALISIYPHGGLFGGGAYLSEIPQGAWAYLKRGLLEGGGLNREHIRRKIAPPDLFRFLFLFCQRLVSGVPMLRPSAHHSSSAQQILVYIVPDYLTTNCSLIKFGKI